MKRTTWIAAIAGVALGFAAGTAFDVVRAGKTIGVMLYMPFEQSAETAFAAYKTSDPRIAVWMLQHHLGRLDEFAKRGYPNSHRISAERFITHARLAKLYAAQGNSQEEQKQIELATSTGFMRVRQGDGLSDCFSVRRAGAAMSRSNHALEPTAGRREVHA